MLIHAMFHVARSCSIKVPSWLHDVFLGYGDPSAAAYYRLPSQLHTINFIDTFLDDAHLQRSFPNRIEFIDEDASVQHTQLLKPAYQLVLPTGVTPNHERLQNMLEQQMPAILGAAAATTTAPAPAAAAPTTTPAPAAPAAKKSTASKSAAPVKPVEPVAPTFAPLTAPVKPTEPVAPAKQKKSSTKKAAAASTDTLDVSTLAGLTVVKLKELLKARDLPAAGVKAVLIERLTAHVQEQATGMETDETAEEEEEDDMHKKAMETYHAALQTYETEQKAYEADTNTQKQQQEAHAKAVKAHKAALKQYESELAKHKKAEESAMEVDSTPATTTSASKHPIVVTPATPEILAFAAAHGPATIPAPLPPTISTVDPSLPPIRVSRIARIAARDDHVKCNEVSFTPVQVEAIQSGCNPGLTMIVGPPGTGKTDTAVQIVSELYHNFPQQRTLLVTHSNQALNDLFEKIMQRDIDERYLLRQGRGQEYLER